MTDFSQLSKDMNKLANRLPGAIARAETDSARWVLGRCRMLSSGPVTMAMMQTVRFGPHPFAVKRWARPLLPPQIINQQTGLFRNAWTMTGVSVTSDGTEVHVQNLGRIASYLKHGTEKMFDRPIDVEAVKGLAKVRVDNINKEIEKITVNN